MHILRLDCSDQPGIVADVAGLMRDCGFNIEHSSQFNDAQAGHFYLRTVFGPAPGRDKADLKSFIKDFGGLADHYAMSWRIDDQTRRPRVMILTSRDGHCLNDLLYRWQSGRLAIEPCAVISNHEDHRALTEWHGLPYHCLPVTPESRGEQERRIEALIEENGAELIVLARYMQILSDGFCKTYGGRIINIHHSFLPGFKGAKPYHQAYERGVKIIGATAHFVTPDLDEGPIIEQETVRIDHTMSPPELQALGADIEARVLARAIALYAERRIFLSGSRTVIL